MMIKLLCNYTSDVYRLGCHKVWIIALPILQIGKELLPLIFLH